MTNHQYLFNGKELEEDHGLNTYDFSARTYMPDMGRWSQQDPLIHFAFSSYSVFDSNPANYIDPLGTDAANPNEGRELDLYGRNRYDKYGNYIRPDLRTVQPEYELSWADQLAVYSLRKTAKLYVNGQDLTGLSEKKKQEYFTTDALATIGILL